PISAIRTRSSLTRVQAKAASRSARRLLPVLGGNLFRRSLGGCLLCDGLLCDGLLCDGFLGGGLFGRSLLDGRLGGGLGLFLGLAAQLLALLGLLSRLALLRVAAGGARHHAGGIQKAQHAVGRLCALGEPALGLLDV